VENSVSDINIITGRNTLPLIWGKFSAGEIEITIVPVKVYGNFTNHKQFIRCRYYRGDLITARNYKIKGM
jgi:hypothetical protein